MPTPYPFESEDAYLEALDKGDGRALLTETPDGVSLLKDFQESVDDFEDTVLGIEKKNKALAGDEEYAYLLEPAPETDVHWPDEAPVYPYSMGDL